MKTDPYQNLRMTIAGNSASEDSSDRPLKDRKDLWKMGASMVLAAWLAWTPCIWAANQEPGRGEDVLRATLDNGLRIVVVRNPLAPVATTVVNYLVGSNEAPEGFPGMAHAQEHMMLRGSPGLSSDQLADITAAMGGVFDADTQQMATQYLFTVPADDLDVALHLVAILTPEPSGKPVASKGFGGTESFAPRQPKTVTLPDWAGRALKRLSIPHSTVHPEVTILPNGLRLIVQPESVSNTVSVYGHIKNNADLETPQGKEGVDQVLDQLLSFGTTSLDRLAFQKALDDIGANASAGTDFSLQVLVDSFERGVELLADNELHPALPERVFGIVQGQVAAVVAGRLESPGYLASRALNGSLYPKNDPTLRQATPATVSSLTLQDVRDYYQNVFRPDLTTIVVIGKVRPEWARAVIETNFSGWRVTGRKPETLLPRVPPNRPSSVAVPDSSRVQDKVTLAETLELDRSNQDYYALELGNHVLGGGFYATRLFQDLREKSGLVYDVSSSLDAGMTRAVYVVTYASDPPNVSKARAIVERNPRVKNGKWKDKVDKTPARRGSNAMLRANPMVTMLVWRLSPLFILLRRT